MRFLPQDPNRRVLLGLAAAFVVPAVYSVYMLLGAPITAREKTDTRMFITKHRILEYALQHDQLPPNLAALPPAASVSDSSLDDAWGRPLDYGFDPSGVVTLKSLGADKLPGGDGENKDMIGTFYTRDAEGARVEATTGWARDPYKQ